MTAQRKAFFWCTGADTAGTAYRLSRAFEKHAEETGWVMRQTASATNYIGYPVDLPYELPTALAYYDAADLVALSSSLHGHHWFDGGQGKPTVLMHHGYHRGHFDKDVWQIHDEAVRLNVTEVGSTVNLELLGPQVIWTPTPYDLDALAAFRARHYRPDPDGRLRFVHAPTNREVKSTEAIIRAFDALEARGLPIKLVLIERRSHADTMTIKARHGDIMIDQFKLGYGCNAIEAWALGMPVIGGVSEHPDWRAHMVARYGLSSSPTGLPFYETDETSLVDAIRAFTDSAELRIEWAGIGREHVLRHHSEIGIARLVGQIYDKALRQPSIPSHRSTSRRRRVSKLTDPLIWRQPNALAHSA